MVAEPRLDLPPWNYVFLIEAEARERGMTFDEVMAWHYARAKERFPWIGEMSDDPDLSLRIEEIMLGEDDDADPV